MAHDHASSGAWLCNEYTWHAGDAGGTTANLELALVLSNVLPHLFLYLLCAVHPLAEGFPQCLCVQGLVA